MLDPKSFTEQLERRGSSWFTGVPDSLLKEWCSYNLDKLSSSNHVIAANEGSAVGLAIGNYLSTEKVPVLYMQNSGLGNAVNPLISLADGEVYSVPILLVIGWRGEPGVKDEPQHISQGPATPNLLDAIGIPYKVLPTDEANAQSVINYAYDYMEKECKPFALLVRKNTFEKYQKDSTRLSENKYEMNREDALQVVLSHLDESTVYVGTTGKLSRELFELRKENNQSHEKDFLTVGGMGHASQIALQIAQNKPNKKVVCLDGDGAVLMHMGGIATIGEFSLPNFVHIVFNNQAHESVGGQPVTARGINFCDVAKASKYPLVYEVSTRNELESVMKETSKSQQLTFISINISQGSRSNLGRPDVSPKQNKSSFMQYLKSDRI